MDFVNEYGFEEWWTEDREHRRITCYANKYVELHTKEPICECGHMLDETAKDRWYCSECGAEYSYDDLYRSFGPDADDYNQYDGTIQDDYGERKYENLPMMCGPEELYYERYRKR